MIKVHQTDVTFDEATGSWEWSCATCFDSSTRSGRRGPQRQAEATAGAMMHREEAARRGVTALKRDQLAALCDAISQKVTVTLPDGVEVQGTVLAVHAKSLRDGGVTFTVEYLSPTAQELR